MTTILRLLGGSALRVGGAFSLTKKSPRRHTVWKASLTTSLTPETRDGNKQTCICKEHLTMKPGIDLTGDPARQPRHRFDLFEGGGKKGLRGAEMLQYLLFARGSNARQLVEDRAAHLRTPEFSMVGISEAVRLVP